MAVFLFIFYFHISTNML